MKLLFIDGCVRGEGSRTRALAERFLTAFTASHPETLVQTVQVNRLRLLPLFEDTLAARDRLMGAWEHEEFAPAKAFRDADFIVLAAPFWEGTFPSAVHAYLEHICVTGLTFTCTEHGYSGLCRAGKAVFVTTRGGIYESGPAMPDDHAEAFLGSVFRMLGIPELHTLSAEGLDIVGADVGGIMEKAYRTADELARKL